MRKIYGYTTIFVILCLLPPLILTIQTDLIQKQIKEIKSMDCDTLLKVSDSIAYTKSARDLAERKHFIFCEHGTV